MGRIRCWHAEIVVKGLDSYFIIHADAPDWCEDDDVLGVLGDHLCVGTVGGIVGALLGVAPRSFGSFAHVRVERLEDVGERFGEPCYVWDEEV